MAAPNIEEYEQILAQDPSSPVFAELAAALIQRGSYEKAIEICTRALEHHRDSILVHVFWGKALIGLGRAAAAMEQFERAIAVDRQNPYAYNLISEALLQKSLYRSALPILRKAVALQPHDEQIRNWLEQAQVAVAKGPGAAWPQGVEPLRSSGEVPLPAHPSATVPSAPAESFEPEIPLLSSEMEPEQSPFEAEPAPTTDPQFSPRQDDRRPSLLGDLPDSAGPVAPIEEAEPPRVDTHVALEIAKKYEQELHHEFTQEKARKSFLSHHGWKLAIGAVLGIPLTVGLVNYLRTRAAHRGQDLKDTLALAKRAIAQDTRKSYAAALESLSRALEWDDESREAWALTGYVQALLYSEHGAGPKAAAKAISALDHPRVRSQFPGLALAAEYYLAEGEPKEVAKHAILASKFEDAEVQELAGRILLRQSDSKGALARYGQALKVAPGNVRTLVELADYYRSSTDHATALKFYGGAAAQISPEHPGRIIGAAESRLALGLELDEALKEMETLPPPEELPAQYVARQELVHGRLLMVGGQHQKAIDKLSKGARTFPALGYEFNFFLAEANRAAGQMDAAQRAIELAFKERPKSEEAKELLGRILIARDREKEALSRLGADPRSRKISLIRGEAYARLGDWKRARAELANTQLDGRFPSEAALYLALADAAEGQAERAQSTLEKALAGSRRARSDLRVALGKVYWQRGILDKARSQFEEAARDPEDYEGSCALGRLLLSHGTPEAAIEPLSRAVARNGSHGEARHLLGRAYLDLGKIPEALTQFEAWERENPGALPEKDLALALFYAGKFKESEAAANKALKSNPNDAESHRVRAMALFSRSQTKVAFSELERANHLNSKDAETFCEIGHAFVRQGNSTNALKAYAAAKREDTESICGTIGLHFAKLPAGGRSAIRELSVLANQTARVWNRAFAQSTLARLLLAAGLQKEARKAAEQAVALAPFFGEGHLSLGLVALRQKEEDKAREELGRAADLEPSHGGVRLALADLLARRSDSASQAIEQYQVFLRIGGNRKDEARVKRLLPNLKKHLASR